VAGKRTKGRGSAVLLEVCATDEVLNTDCEDC